LPPLSLERGLPTVDSIIDQQISLQKVLARREYQLLHSFISEIAMHPFSFLRVAMTVGKGGSGEKPKICCCFPFFPEFQCSWHGKQSGEETLLRPGPASFDFSGSAFFPEGKSSVEIAESMIHVDVDDGSLDRSGVVFHVDKITNKVL